MARKKKRNRSGGSSGTGGPRIQSKFTYWFLRIAPVVTVVLVLALYFGAKQPEGAAAAGVLGLVAWLAVGLGSLGSTIPPRDTTRGGAIDFGKTQNPR